MYVDSALLWRASWPTSFQLAHPAITAARGGGGGGGGGGSGDSGSTASWRVAYMQYEPTALQLAEEEQQRLDPMPRHPMPRDLQQRERAAVGQGQGGELAAVRRMRLPADFWTVGVPLLLLLLLCLVAMVRRCFLWSYTAPDAAEMRPLQLQPTRKFAYTEQERTFEVLQEDLGAGHVVMRQVEQNRAGGAREEDEQVL